MTKCILKTLNGQMIFTVNSWKSSWNINNSCGDRIIKLIDKSRRAPDENRLPKSTKECRKFLDVNEFPYMKFKTVPITNFQDTIYNFYYQPIIHGIKVLLLQSDVNEEFIFKYRNKDTSFKTYGEQYESDWWNNTQKTISLDNYLLSIIIYSDSTTYDYLRSEEHTSELQSQSNLVCRLLLEKKTNNIHQILH